MSLKYMSKLWTFLSLCKPSVPLWGYLPIFSSFLFIFFFSLKIYKKIYIKNKLAWDRGFRIEKVFLVVIVTWFLQSSRCDKVEVFCINRRSYKKRCKIMCARYIIWEVTKKLPFVFLIKLRQKTLSESVIKTTKTLAWKVFLSSL